MAKIYFRYGTMGSGKSIDLLKVAYNYEQRGHKVMLITAKIDTRAGGDFIATRIGLKRPAHVYDQYTNVYELVADSQEEIACVLVDEAQFLSNEQVDQLSDVVDKLKIPVMCYGLRTDFQTKTFPGSDRLLEIADKIEEIKTICTCGKKAIYNARFLDGKIVTSGEQILIGDIEYKALCRNCYKNEKKNEVETNCKNERALIIGRFEPIHMGHEKLINIGLEKADVTVVYVTKNENDSMTVQVRIKLIGKIYRKEIEDGKLIVSEYINPKERNVVYGEKVLAHFKKSFGKNPDLLIYGDDKEITNCFAQKDMKDIKTIKAKRDEISATKIRNALKNQESGVIEKFVNPKIILELKNEKMQTK